ncbi:MAG: Lrp/AsnC family transcriptional regulator [Halobacterium sp.]
MVHAFIMVKTGAGAASDVRDQLGGIEGVQAAHVVAGRYDIIAEVDSDEVHEVLATVSKDIGTVAGVTDTKTYVSLSAA